MFTFNSDFLSAKAVTLGCPADRMEILRMGVELPSESPAVRSSRGTLRLLTVARLVPEKGIGDAIAAVEQAVETTADLSFRVIGGGPLEATLRAQISAAGLEDVVTLTGPASAAEVRAAYAESDLFVLPSIRSADGSEEAQGLVLQEAQSRGLPVIATNIGGIPEGVDHGMSGYLVEPGDVEALAARFVECSRDPALRDRLGRNGRALVEQRFSIERLNDQLVELYEETIGRRRLTAGDVR